MPAGRPTKYKPEYCELVISLAQDGASIKELALHIDVDRDTIYEWEKVHPEFSDALKKARSLQEAWWEKQGRIFLQGKEFNHVLWYMNMKNRFGWRDKHEVQSTVTITDPVSIDDLESQIQDEESREE